MKNSEIEIGNVRPENRTDLDPHRLWLESESTLIEIYLQRLRNEAFWVCGSCAEFPHKCMGLSGEYTEEAFKVACEGEKEAGIKAIREGLKLG